MIVGSEEAYESQTGVILLLQMWACLSMTYNLKKKNLKSKTQPFRLSLVIFRITSLSFREGANFNLGVSCLIGDNPKVVYTSCQLQARQFYFTAVKQ